MNIDTPQYHDFSVFSDLRRNARSEGETAEDNVKVVAKQFESIFVQMMMKSMRDTVPEGGLLNDESMRFYQDMMDQQLSLELSQQGGIGMAETIERQLSPPKGVNELIDGNAKESALKLAIGKHD